MAIGEVNWPEAPFSGGKPQFGDRRRPAVRTLVDRQADLASNFDIGQFSRNALIILSVDRDCVGAKGEAAVVGEDNVSPPEIDFRNRS